MEYMEILKSIDNSLNVIAGMIAVFIVLYPFYQALGKRK